MKNSPMISNGISLVDYNQVKAKDLSKHVANLYAVETIDSLKKCKQ